MRILVISNLYPPMFLGGYELACAQITEELRVRGHQVAVLTSASAGISGESSVVRAMSLARIYEESVMSSLSERERLREWTRAAWVNDDNVAILINMIEEFNPDVVYAWNLLGIGGIGLLAALSAAGLPVVWHLEDSIPAQLCIFGGRLNALALRTLQRAAPRYVLSCSARLVAEIVSAGVQLPSKWIVCPNWVSGHAPEPRVRPLKAPFRLVHAVATAGSHKGSHLLADICAQLRMEGFSAFTLDLYGAISDPALLGTLIARFGDQINLRGALSREQLIDTYRDNPYDIFVFPTWSREPFGIAPLEAAAYGCLPIVTADCGIAEWFVDGVHLLKAERCPSAFARRIVEALESPDKTLETIQRAQRVIWRDFTVERIATVIEVILARASTGKVERTAAKVNNFARFASRLIDVLVCEHGGAIG